MGNNKNKRRAKSLKHKDLKRRKKDCETSVSISDKTGQFMDCSSDLSGINTIAASTPKVVDRNLSSPTCNPLPNDLTPNSKLIAKHFPENEDVQHYELCKVPTTEEEREQQSQSSEKIPLGNRNHIVSVETMRKELRKVYDHENTCGDMFISNSTPNGMASIITYSCKNCPTKLKVHSHSPIERNELNMTTITGGVSSGQGHEQIVEFMSHIGVHTMDKNTFSLYEEKLHENLEPYLENMIISNIEEEKRLAKENGDIDSDGVPFIAVIGDGGWGVRSYNHSMKSSVGCAVVIGARTKKILYIGTRNKYCYVCETAEKTKSVAPEHPCTRNHNGPSTQMESDMLVEAFCISEPRYGIRYMFYIGDGDSSVMVKIAQKCPYGNRVVKIPCRNHSIRAYTSALYGITVNTSLGDKKTRAIVKSKIEKLIKAVNDVIVKYSKLEGTMPAHMRTAKMKWELKNGPYHVFGDHSRCGDWCTKKETVSQNEVELLKDAKIWPEIEKKLYHIIANAANLKPDTTTNLAECFMAMNSRIQGSKRIARCKKNKYRLRTIIAALKFCRGYRWTYGFWKTMHESSPNIVHKKLINSREKRSAQAKSAKTLRFELHPENRARCRKKSEARSKKPDCDYGSHAAQPDIDPEEMEKRQNDMMARLYAEVETEELRFRLCMATIHQYASKAYRDAKEFRLTASKYGRVMILEDTTHPHNAVKEILDTTKNLDHKPSIRYGRENEPLVRDKHAEKIGKTIDLMGLCTNESLPFLAASPDGGIGNDGTVEIKCLFSGRDKSVEQYAADLQGVDLNGQPIIEEDGKPKKKNKKFYKFCLEYHKGKLRLKRKCEYYYQVQGQLGISGRSYCDFVAATDVNQFCERINFDPKTWEEMVEKLTRFYKHCLLPELIDSRIDRDMQVRTPDYHIEALKAQEAEKAIKKAEKEAEKARKEAEKASKKEEKARKKAEKPKKPKKIKKTK